MGEALPQREKQCVRPVRAGLPLDVTGELAERSRGGRQLALEGAPPVLALHQLQQGQVQDPGLPPESPQRVRVEASRRRRQERLEEALPELGPHGVPEQVDDGPAGRLMSQGRFLRHDHERDAPAGELGVLPGADVEHDEDHPKGDVRVLAAAEVGEHLQQEYGRQPQHRDDGEAVDEREAGAGAGSRDFYQSVEPVENVVTGWVKFGLDEGPGGFDTEVPLCRGAGPARAG